MAKLNMTIPEGTRDLLYGEADLYGKIIADFTDIYEKAGFSRICTPAIENYGLFCEMNPSLEEENLYKLTDNKGKLVVLRPDNTTPIARVAATKLRDASLPLKLYYDQHIYRVNSENSGMRNEILQSGIELIGAGGIKGDLICITAALDVLRATGLDFKLEIGHVGYFNAIIADMNLTDEEKMAVRAYVEAKNFVSLGMFNKNLQSDTVRALPLLYGNGEVFSKAAELAGGNTDAAAALNYVRTLYDTLSAAGYGDNIMVDMSMIHKFDYYTGTVIRGYIANAGEPVLKGGRYDNLLDKFDLKLPSTGFAVNVCAVADALIKSGRALRERHSDAIIHFDAESLCTALEIKRRYADEGKVCELSMFDSIEETAAYASAGNIGEVIDLTEGKEVG